ESVFGRSRHRRFSFIVILVRDQERRDRVRGSPAKKAGGQRGGMRQTVKIVSDIEELAAYRRRWASLLERSACNRPTMSPTWLLSWWRVFGDGDRRRLAAIVVLDGDRLVGLAPLCIRRHWYPPGIPFRRVELLASGEPEEDAICSEYLGVIAERGQEADVAV